MKEVTPEELADFQASEPAILDVLRHRTLASITDEDISKASSPQQL